MMTEHPLPKDLVDPFAAGPIMFEREPTLIDRDGSLHVVAAGSIRCQECGKTLHLNEVPFCSGLCRMRHDERMREAAA